MFLGVVLSILLLWVLFRDHHKASLLTSLAILLFFSYGHISNLLVDYQIIGIQLSSDRFLVPVYFFVTILITWKIQQQNKYSQELTKLLNRIALVLVIISLLQISYFIIRGFITNNQIIQDVSQSSQTKHDLNKIGYPDIYYIILDGYTRDDILFNTFKYDNSDFLSNLEDRNFYIARCSQANYSYTRPAMASTFNMTYLGNQVDQNHIALDEYQLNEMIKSSYVQGFVESNNYTTITFDTGYKWLNWTDPDIFFTPFTTRYKRFQYTKLNDFEVLLVKTSALSIILDRINLEDFLSTGPREIQQTRILYTFNTLSKIPKLVPELKFVYAHITAPHSPYIFGPNGELLKNNPKSEIDGYINQINHINTLVINMIDEIISGSERLPVIIIQGDHGANIDYKSLNIDQENTLGILNAYYLPGVEFDKMYDSLSPVNTFRNIFNYYFSSNYQLLEDLSILGNESPYIKLICNPKPLK